jgi:hypothetical protein
LWRACKEKGVAVKAGGVFAYVPYSLMPWRYKNIQWWNHVLPQMKDIKFFGKVIDVDYSVPMIKIDAREEIKITPKPQVGRTYKGE